MYPGWKVAKSFFEPSREVDSVFSEVILVSTSDKEFEFDDLVIDSLAYRKAIDGEGWVLVPKTAALKTPTYSRKKITANENIRHLHVF